MTDQYPPPPGSVPPPDPTSNPVPPAYPQPPVAPYAPPVNPPQVYAPQAYAPQAYAPQAYPPPPGFPPPPYGHPGQPPVDPGVNGFAIASLACGFFGIIGAVLATVFGIIALNQIKQSGQRGRGLAIAGLCLSALWLVLIIAGIAIAVAGTDTAGHTPADTIVPTVARSTPADDPATPPTEESTPSDKFVPGKCLNDLDGTRTPVSCAAPHDGEVYAVFDLRDRNWPGVNAIKQEALAGCDSRLGSYAKNPSKLNYYYLYPDESSWPDDRSVICIAADPHDKKLTGSVRR